jgi:hypothetical protein
VRRKQYNLCVNLRLTGITLICRLQCGDCFSGFDSKNDLITSPSLLDISMLAFLFLDKHMLSRKVRLCIFDAKAILTPLRWKLAANVTCQLSASGQLGDIEKDRNGKLQPQSYAALMISDSVFDVAVAASSDRSAGRMLYPSADCSFTWYISNMLIPNPAPG